MKLIEIRNGHSIRDMASIRINQNGTIWFSQKVVKELFLENSSITICQDEEKPRDFYIRRGGEIKVRKNEKQSTYFCGYISAVRKITETLGLDPEKNYSFRIATMPENCNGEMLHAIITSKAY